MSALIFFMFVSVINVILNTVKSILTVKGSAWSAAIINAVTFGFYTFIIKQVSQTDLVTAIIVTISANMVGVFIGLAIAEKLRQYDTWQTLVLSKEKQILRGLEARELPFVVCDFGVVVTTKNKEQALKLKEFLIIYSVPNFTFKSQNL